MAQPLTTDNVDDIIRNTVRENFNDISNRLRALEQLVREDLSLDKTQKDGSPDENTKLDNIYSKIDEVRMETNLIKEELKLMKEALQLMAQKLENTDLR